MQMRKLGPFSVSAIGLGCMSMSHAYGRPDKGLAVATLNRALEVGYNFLDTAALYGFGHNENLLGEALSGRREEFVLATKGGLYKDADGKRLVDGRPEALRSHCEESLQRLRTDVIDLYYLHRVDPKVPVEDSIGALSELVAEGKIKTIGMSEVAAPTLRRAHAVHPITALQSEYSLWTRNPEGEVLDTCKELGVTFVPFSPLARAFLTGKMQDMSLLQETDLRHTMPRFQGENFINNLELLDAYELLATEVGCTPGQLALGWLLAQAGSMIPIPGTTHPEFAEENIVAVEVSLTAEQLARAEAIINPGTVSGERYNEAVLATMETWFAFGRMSGASETQVSPVLSLRHLRAHLQIAPRKSKVSLSLNENNKNYRRLFALLTWQLNRLS